MRRTIVATGLLLAATLPATALPREKERWIRVDTSHFTLFSNASKSRTVRIGSNLERLRDVLAHTSAGMNLNSPLPTYIYVFKDQIAFIPYNIGDNEMQRDWSGYFVASRTGNYVAIDASAGSEPFGVVYHEYLHYFLRNNLPAVPLWLNEGLAEFYSNFVVRGDRAEIGRPIDRHLRWLADRSLIPLDELFSLDTASSDYNEGTRQGTVYAQSWALTHYLLTDPVRRGQTGKFFGLLNQGLDEREAFESAFETDLAAAEAALGSYVRKQSFRFYKYPVRDVERENRTSVIRMGYREVLFRLGDLLAHLPTDRLEDAEEHLRVALALDDAHAGLHGALALVRLRQERPVEAAELCRVALELEPDNPQIHSLYGRALIDRYAEQAHTALLLQARRHFRKSLELAPDDHETLADLGKTFLFGHGDIHEGIDTLAQAAVALPTRTDLWLELITLTARSGDTTGARTLLDEVLRPRATESQIHAAEVLIAEPELRRARALLREGREEEAQAVIRSVAEQTQSPRLKLTLLTRLVAISTEVAATDSIATFNEAVDRARHGEMESAAELLERLLQSARQPDLRAAAETHLSEIRRVLGHNRLVERFNEAVRTANEGNIDEASAILQKVLESNPSASLRRETRALLDELRSSERRRTD